MASDRLHDPRRVFRQGLPVRMREQVNGWEGMTCDEDDAGLLTEHTENRVPTGAAMDLHEGLEVGFPRTACGFSPVSRASSMHGRSPREGVLTEQSP